MRRAAKLLTLSLALVLAVSALAACAQPTAPAATTAPTKAPAAAATTPAGGVAALSKEYKMSMATGGTAGTYYPYGGAIAGLWGKNLKGVTVTVEATGGSVENMRRLASKEVELAFTQNDIADYAYKGTEMFKDNKVTNFRSLAALYPEVLQWVVTPDIKSVADLKGKAFVVGAAGSGTEVNTRQVLESNGMSYKDLGKVLNLSFAEAATAMKDRQVQGFAVTGGVPTAAITDAAASTSIALLPIDGDFAKNTLDKNRFMVSAKIPANSYKGQTTDVNTVAVLSTLVVREDLDNDLVYWLTKTLFDKQAELAAAHAKGKELSKDTAIKGLTVPLHPGAEKYYKEIGLIK